MHDQFETLRPQAPTEFVAPAIPDFKPGTVLDSDMFPHLHEYFQDEDMTLHHPTLEGDTALVFNVRHRDVMAFAKSEGFTLTPKCTSHKGQQYLMLDLAVGLGEQGAQHNDFAFCVADDRHRWELLRIIEGEDTYVYVVSGKAGDLRFAFKFPLGLAKQERAGIADMLLEIWSELGEPAGAAEEAAPAKEETPVRPLWFLTPEMRSVPDLATGDVNSMIMVHKGFLALDKIAERFTEPGEPFRELIRAFLRVAKKKRRKQGCAVFWQADQLWNGPALALVGPPGDALVSDWMNALLKAGWPVTERGDVDMTLDDWTGKLSPLAGYDGKECFALAEATGAGEAAFSALVPENDGLKFKPLPAVFALMEFTWRIWGMPTDAE